MTSKEVQLKLDDTGRGLFFIEENNKRIAWMDVAVSSDNLTSFHTEVNTELRGQGLAAQLLAAMVLYAREHKLKVIPLCAYVKSQFAKFPDQYADIWNQQWHK